MACRRPAAIYLGQPAVLAVREGESERLRGTWEPRIGKTGPSCRRKGMDTTAGCSVGKGGGGVVQGYRGTKVRTLHLPVSPSTCQPADRPSQGATVPPYVYVRVVCTTINSLIVQCSMYFGQCNCYCSLECTEPLPVVLAVSAAVYDCTALRCPAQTFVLFFSPFLHGSAAPGAQLPSKPGSRAGHDIETPTGLGTHKSARACYEPPQPPHKSPHL